MNKQRLLDIADRIEREPQTFDMSQVLNRCGTVGCIMGQAIMLFDPEQKQRPSYQLDSIARGLLGLDHDQAKELFYAESLDVFEDDDEGDRLHIDCGYEVIEKHYRGLVPIALRWMVHRNKINWEEALHAVKAIDELEG